MTTIAGFMESLKNVFPRPDASDNPAMRTALIALVAIAGGLGAVGYAAGPAWPVAFLWAIASLAGAGILGFLFGVPKVLQDDTKRTDGYRQVVNTNLDQISDWLTKVVVGLTLVNARQLSRSLQGTADILANALGGRPADLAVALGLIVYFSAIGFLATYILTRLYLAQAFYQGDQPQEVYRKAQKLAAEADDAERTGKNDEAKKLRDQALAELRGGRADR